MGGIKRIKISVSLAAAPLDRVGEIVRSLTLGQVDYLHFDIEDGIFVPMITLGTKIIQDLRPLTSLPFDVHLMMMNPEWLIPDLVRMGANRIAVHYEACPYPRRTLRKIVEAGAQAGIALNPATPLPDLAYLRPYLSFVLILTSEPEMPDCPFLPAMLEKVRQGRRQPGLNGVEWVVDGGINPQNLPQVVAAGADVLVIGRAIFKDSTVQENLRLFHHILDKVLSHATSA
ncbi:ribulose-phosphate 3-epimerase [Thermoflexus sp.]|uniref:ribulose-phosphate 3-epimerase n=1 Tax=Thermoflexus sp. TaxID=1969742 RepID=UPI002ADDA3AC|nr:ribulose-phosphate 3-epimerase [Thermoflexus sp.]